MLLLQCNRTTSLDVFHNAVEEREGFTQYIGVIGCGCSVASLPVAEISHYYNMPMVRKRGGEGGRGGGGEGEGRGRGEKGRGGEGRGGRGGGEGGEGRGSGEVGGEEGGRRGGGGGGGEGERADSILNLLVIILYTSV